MNQKDFFTVAECAKYLGIKENHIRQLLWQRRLAFYKQSGRTLILKKDAELRLRIVKAD